MQKNLITIGIVVAILLAGYGLGYTTHKEFIPVPITVPSPVTVTSTVTAVSIATTTRTEHVTTTVYEVKNITIMLYKPIEQLDVSVRKTKEMNLRIYVTNKGNTTLRNIVIYIKTLEIFFGLSTTKEIVIEDIEPGITKTYDIWVQPFTKYLYMFVLVPQPID